MSRNIQIGPRGNLLYLIMAVLIAMVGYTIHGSLFWAIVDFFFWPLAIIKWLICKQLTLAVIKLTFAWFFV
jgi:hypothetical protein